MFDVNLEEALSELEESNKSVGNAFAIPRPAGLYLHKQILLHRPRRIIELGTSTGYSTLWIASAAAKYGGIVETVDRDPEKIERAIDSIRRAYLQSVVIFHEADAAEFVQSIEGLVNSVFMDTDKSGYLTQFKLFYPKMSCGGVVYADNAINMEDEMSDYLDYVKKLSPALSITIPIGNGLEVTYKFS